jgi:acetoin:2,6-dichlorophenolindophenol oxidoreductase subunit alpha
MFAIHTTVRQCDERFRSMITAGQIALIYHSPRGQECISAAWAVHLRPDDYVLTVHRGLHDQLAQGVPLRELWAEALGRSTGTGKGKGGPAHLAHPASGLMVTTDVVGAGIPIANGFALAAQLRRTDQVTVVNFGDGAADAGAFHEGLNLAAVWNLPVVFVCQNNGRPTPVGVVTGAHTISSSGPFYGMESVRVDGDDPVALWQVLGAAVHRARSGRGPTLVEAVTTPSWDEAAGTAIDDGAGAGQVASAADAVDRYRQWLVDSGHATNDELDAIETTACAAVDDAVAFALDSPFPEAAELTTDVLAEAAW